MQTPTPEDILFNAIKRNDKNTIQHILSFANVNLPDLRGRTFLMYAAAEGNPEIVELLLNEGANVAARSNDEGTALIYAISLQRVAVVHMLIKHGADINVVARGLSAIQLAVHVMNMDIVKMLISSGVNLNHYTQFQPALHRAVMQQNTELVNLLLHAGADMYAFNKWGISAVGLAIFKGYTKILGLFLNKGLNLALAVDTLGNSPLHIAATFTHGDMFGLLVTRGANMFAVNNRGLTPLKCLKIKPKTQNHH